MMLKKVVAFMGTATAIMALMLGLLMVVMPDEIDDSDMSL